MEYITIVRIVHVLGVIFWIGGVAMVTPVLIPAIKKMKSKEEQPETFEKIEGRFAIQAKVTTVVTGLINLKRDHHSGCPGRKPRLVFLLNSILTTNIFLSQ